MSEIDTIFNFLLRAQAKLLQAAVILKHRGALKPSFLFLPLNILFSPLNIIFSTLILLEWFASSKKFDKHIKCLEKMFNSFPTAHKSNKLTNI